MSDSVARKYAASSLSQVPSPCTRVAMNCTTPTATSRTTKASAAIAARLLSSPARPCRMTSAAISATPITRTTQAILRSMSRPPASKRHVLVDMTPLEPGGQNGGAGLVATSLVRELGQLAPDVAFTLLTASSSHAELAALDTTNVERGCVWDRR